MKKQKANITPLKIRKTRAITRSGGAERKQNKKQTRLGIVRAKGDRKGNSGANGDDGKGNYTTGHLQKGTRTRLGIFKGNKTKKNKNKNTKTPNTTSRCRDLIPPLGPGTKDRRDFIDRGHRCEFRPFHNGKGLTQALIPSISISPVPAPSHPSPRRKSLLSSSATSPNPSPRVRAATWVTSGWVRRAARRSQ